MAGAVDLSALKQRASAGDGSSAAPSGGVEITEANLEAEVLVRSSQVPVVVLLWSPRSDASIQLGDALGSLASADGGKWSLATAHTLRIGNRLAPGDPTALLCQGAAKSL